MKKLINIACILIIAFFAVPGNSLFAQVKVTDGAVLTMDANSLLELESTNKGLLIPRVAINNLNLVAPLTGTVPAGMMVYSNAGSVSNGFYYWSGTNWVGLGSDGFSTAPYASYIDTTDQVLSSTSVAYPVRYNVNNAQFGFTHTEGTSAITATYSGKYLITFSGIFQTNANGKEFNIWLRVNGVNYNYSRTNFIISDIASNRVISVTYIIQLNAGQNFELVMHSNNEGALLNFTPKQNSPSMPACPSIILTVNKISN